MGIVQTTNAPVDASGNIGINLNNVNTTVPVSGTVTANLGTSGSIATETTLSTLNDKIPTGITLMAPYNALLVQNGLDLPITGISTANNTNVLEESIEDMSNYTHVVVQITGTWVATLTPQISNNGTTWFDTTLIQLNSSIATVATTITTNGVYLIPVEARHFRLRTTSFTSGSISGLAMAKNGPWQAFITPSLPTGASTSALQTTGNTSLSSIDSKTPALGQALASASTPVVLTAAQLTTLTPLSTVAVTQSTSPWVVSGTVTAANGSVSNTAAAVPSQATMVGGSDGTNLRAVKVSSAGVVSVDGSAVTQPVSIAATVTVSGTVTANLDTISGVATETTLAKSIGISTGGTYGALTMTTSGTTYEVKVGASKLSNRISVTATPTTADVFWGYDSSVTTSTGTKIFKDQTMVWDMNPSSTAAIFLVSASNSVNVRITEAP